MRARRFRRQAEETVLPTYELLLKHDEEARAVTKTLENIEKGSQLMLKCTMAQEHFENLVFRANNIEIGSEDGQSKTLTINSFSRMHTGMYECGATRKSDGKYHSRQMRVKQKRDKSTNMPPCSTDSEGYCGMHGMCLMDGSRQFCQCDDGYMGETCDKVLMTAYEAKLLKVVGGTTTSLNVLCVLIAILFALLYFKERKSNKKLRQEFTTETMLEENPDCEKCDAVYKETTISKPETSNGTSEGNTSFARNSIRKMRLALNRARLNGTSDSKLLEK